METVRVTASRDYTIYIENGLLEEAGAIVRRDVPGAQKVAVITDDIVAGLYLENLKNALNAAGLDVCAHVFTHGEEHKSVATLSGVLDNLAAARLTRSDCILTLGGGIPGDLGGFAAAVYQRGIRFVQMPTTVLSCVDSSVGGKTAVNLPAGKNLAGAFHQPSAVIIDPDMLRTLPDNIYNDGCAEVIKYGVIMDRDFFNFLAENDVRDNISYVIRRCDELKRDVVNADERDTGIRAILNFGHTAGHAIEVCSGFEISHGSAVGIGMLIESKGAFRAGLTDTDVTGDIAALLEKNGLPTACDFTPDELYDVACSDKKRSGGSIKLIVPKTIGQSEPVEVPVEEMRKVIESGLDH